MCQDFRIYLRILTKNISLGKPQFNTSWENLIELTKTCENCGNKLRKIETGTYIIDTCLICSIEFNDIHEITKGGILKNDYPEESSN